MGLVEQFKFVTLSGVDVEIARVSGELRTRTGVALARGGLMEDLVARRVYANVLTMHRYVPGVIQVVWSTELHFPYAAVDGELTA